MLLRGVKDTSGKASQRKGGEMRSTNEIARAAQNGQADILELWAAVRRLAMKTAIRWGHRQPDVTMEDLEQSAFIALINTLRHWDEGKGQFLTLYGLYIKKHFSETCGISTTKISRDPLNNTPLSLEEPMENNGDNMATLADMIPDPEAEAVFDAVDLKIAVADALQKLSPELRAVIVAEFWYGQRVDSRKRYRAMKKLRNASIRRKLKSYL